MNRILKSKYKIKEKISDSPSHLTYKGAMVDTNDPLIIKIYRRQYLNSVLIKQLKKDVAELAQLDTPCVPKLFDGDYGWQGFYFVREYVDGDSLADTKLPFSHEKAAQTAYDICSILGKAHEQNIVHGSLTPSNIFIVRNSDKIAVADFGINRSVREPSYQRPKWLFDASSAYLAPEVLMGESSSKVSDIYQVGLIMLYMLSPELMAPGRGLSFVLESFEGLQGKLNKIGSKPPKHLTDIIYRCIEKDPLMRFSTLREIQESILTKSVPEKKFGFTEILDSDYSFFDESDTKSQLSEVADDNTVNDKILPTVFPEDISLAKDDKIDFVRWVLFLLAIAFASGILYSLINVLIMGE